MLPIIFEPITEERFVDVSDKHTSAPCSSKFGILIGQW